MAEAAAFEVGDGQSFPIPATFKTPDPILVDIFVGLEWQEFLERLQAMFSESGNGGGGPSVDYRVLVGYLAIAVARANPLWTRQRVIRYVEDVDIDSIRMVFPKAEDDAGPPASKAGSTAPSMSASSSESDSGSTLEQSSPGTSGTPTSPTSPGEPSE